MFLIFDLCLIAEKVRMLLYNYKINNTCAKEMLLHCKANTEETLHPIVEWEHHQFSHSFSVTATTDFIGRFTEK